MDKADVLYGLYTKILEEELLPAGGCTEPIAIAYASAIVRRELGQKPERMDVYASGNLIKNAKGVSIPNGDDLKGVDAAALLGALGGNAERMLEVLLDTPKSSIKETRSMLAEGRCMVHVLDSIEPLHLIIYGYAGGDTVKVELCHTHTNIVHIEKNGNVLFDAAVKNAETPEIKLDYSALNVASIVDFAESIDMQDEVISLLRKQVEYNLLVAEEGLAHKWGSNVGRFYYDRGRYIQAYPSAASDARMNGCNLPVVIVSGSGNQGITASLPVVVYAQEHKIDEEKMLRALIISDLVAIHLKSGIGRLSAFCGVVCAATGSGAALTYLAGGSLEKISATITNSVAITSGMVCDGAKTSCAAKIAASLEGALLAHGLAMDERSFKHGEGIVMEDVEKTIDAIGCVASKGMRETDHVILDLMTS